MTTLHIRCGSDIRDGLAAAGIAGDFLEYSDPVCQGPLPADLHGAAFVEARADFIAHAYDEPREPTLAKLRNAEAGLEAAADHERIVLWMEHDIYDQAVLVRLLDAFADRSDIHDRLFLICIDSFPGIERFIGLGQLTPAQLATLAGTERPVTAEQLALGRRAWAALRAPQPMDLADLLREGTPSLPARGPALRRYLPEYPGVGDGRGVTARQALRAVAGGAPSPGWAFRHIMETDPQPYLGDLMFWSVLRGLAAGPVPLLSTFNGPREPIEVTEAGTELLYGGGDWIALAGGIDRWIGGVHLNGPTAAWRWDGDRESIVPG